MLQMKAEGIQRRQNDERLQSPVMSPGTQQYYSDPSTPKVKFLGDVSWCKIVNELDGVLRNVDI